MRFWARIIALIRLGFVYHDGHILFQLFIASDDGFFFFIASSPVSDTIFVHKEGAL